ncbi:unnamed protein product [Paramecium octaurelia]|uniref:Uncharacterized protein n=1 Tax=Paramecium octaurelia TaxID=43137 RepID=A0A8S1YJ89_PAROT|nr:unnamed protein product [Paramecium octaurelia]
MLSNAIVHFTNLEPQTYFLNIWMSSINSLIKKVKILNEPVMALLLYQILLGIDYLDIHKNI